jgi:hypothetical protein
LNRTQIWLIIVAALLGLIGLFMIYRSRLGQNPNIDPHASDVIENAKRR